MVRTSVAHEVVLADHVVDYFCQVPRGGGHCHVRVVECARLVPRAYVAFVPRHPSRVMTTFCNPLDSVVVVVAVCCCCCSSEDDDDPPPPPQVVYDAVGWASETNTPVFGRGQEVSGPKKLALSYVVVDWTKVEQLRKRHGFATETLHVHPDS